ncbi:hypothetical protein Goari_011428 [Gossypium aridum]|uniref:DUF7745 domain-containing protein n=1 Tax=Gossypium aridum TaxID=34290 RepID=A0A7J8WXA9_GOSAI|nr:hypothetical protein [Gossypium aridum]
MKKRVDVFALGIYGLVVLLKALGYIDEAVLDLFDRLDKRVTPVLAILAEAFRYLNACRRAEEKWIAILQNRQEEDVEWRALWMIPNEIICRCGDFDWVPLLGIWGAIGYASLLGLRQYKLKQFVLATRGLAQCEFSYKGDNYKKKWWGKRVNDNISMPSQGNTRPIEDHLQVIPSELKIIKRDFEKKNSELGKKIEQLKEENMRLGLDIDIHKLEAKKLWKGKNKVEEDLNSLKTNYKKLRMSIRTVSLGKTSEQWRQEIKEEKIKVD